MSEENCIDIKATVEKMKSYFRGRRESYRDMSVMEAHTQDAGEWLIEECERLERKSAALEFIISEERKARGKQEIDETIEAFREEVSELNRHNNYHRSAINRLASVYGCFGETSHDVVDRSLLDSSHKVNCLIGYLQHLKKVLPSVLWPAELDGVIMEANEFLEKIEKELRGLYGPVKKEGSLYIVESRDGLERHEFPSKAEATLACEGMNGRLQC